MSGYRIRGSLGGGLHEAREYVPPKVPPTPRQERRDQQDRTKIENAWACYDSLSAEVDRLLAAAYRNGHTDGRAGRPERIPTRDSMKRNRR